MELFSIIFRLGVVFAIFGFIWGIFELAMTLLRGGRPVQLFEIYFLKSVKYLLLADVTFLFCLDRSNDELSYYNLGVTAIILFVYFMGNLQKQQNKQLLQNFMGRQVQSADTGFNLTAEIIVIGLGIILFCTFYFFPDFAKNPLSIWFHESILDIEDTPIIGFIFKVIGFFFLISMIFKMINGFFYLLSGKPFVRASSRFTAFSKKDKDEFDDFEEI